MNRREFIGGLTTSALLGGCRLLEGEAYSAAVLGDTHYDDASAETFHAKAMADEAWKKRHPMRVKEFARNGKMWSGPSRRILEASGRTVTPDTRFVLQMGDLVQGDCVDPELHKKMLGETLAFMKKVYPKGLPFLPVCGNHDIRLGDDKNDNGALAAYEEFMIPYSRAEVGGWACGTVDDTTYGFRSGPDLYVMINFNKARQTMPVVKRLFAENPDVRYTFVVTHGGVLPFDCWCRWCYLGEPREDDARREMRALFAARNAIVLSGHTHHLELKDAEFPEGRITEMTMNTVQGLSKGGENPAEPANVREGVETYGTIADVLYPDYKALVEEYKPHLTRFYHANGVGHARLRVSNWGVWFDYYGRDALEPTKTFRLR